MSRARGDACGDGTGPAGGQARPPRPATRGVGTGGGRRDAPAGRQRGRRGGAAQGRPRNPEGGTDRAGASGTARLARRHHQGEGGPGQRARGAPFLPGRATRRRRPTTAARGPGTPPGGARPTGEAGKTRGSAALTQRRHAGRPGRPRRGPQSEAHTTQGGAEAPGSAGGEKAAEETRQGGPRGPTARGAPGRRAGAGEARRPGSPRGEWRGSPKGTRREGKEGQRSESACQGAHGVSPPKGLRAQGRSRGTRNDDWPSSKKRHQPHGAQPPTPPAPPPAPGKHPGGGGDEAAPPLSLFLPRPRHASGPWRPQTAPPTRPAPREHFLPGGRQRHHPPTRRWRAGRRAGRRHPRAAEASGLGARPGQSGTTCGRSGANAEERRGRA